VTRYDLSNVYPICSRHKVAPKYHNLATPRGYRAIPLARFRRGASIRRPGSHRARGSPNSGRYTRSDDEAYATDHDFGSLHVAVVTQVRSRCDPKKALRVLGVTYLLCAGPLGVVESATPACAGKVRVLETATASCLGKLRVLENATVA